MSSKNMHAKKQKQKPKKTKTSHSPSGGMSSLTAPAAVGYSFTPSKNFKIRQNLGGNKVLLKHEEFFALVPNLAGTTGFTLTDYSFNPGSWDFGTWLSSEVVAYSLYRLRRFRVKYVGAAPTTAKGQIYLGLDPNADNANANINSITEANLTNLTAVSSCVPWANTHVELRTEQHPFLGMWRKVRQNARSPVGPLSTFDACTVYIGTVGQADTSNIGKLFLEYEVEVDYPTLVPNIVGTSLGYGNDAMFLKVNSTNITNNINTTLSLLNYSTPEGWCDTTVSPIAGSSATTIQLPPGSYIVTGSITLDDASDTSATVNDFFTTINTARNAFDPPSAGRRVSTFPARDSGHITLQLPYFSVLQTTVLATLQIQFLVNTSSASQVTATAGSFMIRCVG